MSTIDRGSRIGRFVVVSELGRGGMGAVYAAHDPQLDRQVALKVMRDAAGDEEDRVRMMREGQAMARVTHPNVITVYEVGSEQGIVFLAQELLDGGTLGEWLDRLHEQKSALPVKSIIEKFIAAGRGLAAAHAAGLVHRDFKPDNVLLGKDGRVRVADFGLARAETALLEGLATTQKGGGPPRVDDVTKSPMNQLTRTGAVMGTPMFMAPEQHMGERADARSDQFAFCVSLYHALYKTWPYEGKTAIALADAVIEGRLAPVPKDAPVSASLRKVLLRGLSTEPRVRYPAMEGLLADLEREIAVPRGNRVSWIVAGALVVVAGGASAYAVLQKKNDAPPAPVVVAPKPPPPIDTSALTSEKGVEWFTAALDRGQLDDAIDKYDMATALELQREQPAQAAIAESAGVYMRVLRGDLAGADAKIPLASQHAGTDAVARAHVELAEAALALARGQLPAARDRSKRCASQLEASARALAAICHQLHGEALSSLGDAAGARAAYSAGLAFAGAEQKSTLQLALAQLDLDEGKTESAAQIATKVQTECTERGATGCAVHARILLARIRLGAGAGGEALELLSPVKPATIESFPIRIAHAVALGEVHGYMNETGEDEVFGLDRIESARAQAETRGFFALTLDAKLARLRVLLANEAPEAEAEHDALVKQARTTGNERIARLAEAAIAELAARPTLPVDGGLPDVRSGSSSSP